MSPRRAVLAVLLALGTAAVHAQDTSTSTLPELAPELAPQPPTPAPPPSAPAVRAAAPVALAGASATLSAPRTAGGPLRLTLTVKRAAATVLAVRRDNDQNCALAPLVRAVRVGTREVVYPAPGASPRLCAQDIVTKSTAATGSVTFTRDLTLPPGEYMLEGWLTALADGVPVKVPAAPVRVTVK